MTAHPVTRRAFLTAIAGSSASRAAGTPPRILLRGLWQSVNIGDVGHVPGALDLLHRHFPEASITLWPGRLDDPARALLTRHYPQLRLVEGAVDPQGRPTTPVLAKAWDEADLYLSGTGSGFPASAHAEAFVAATGKPVGVFGVSLDPISGFGAGRDPEGGTLDALRERIARLGAGHLPSNLRSLIDRCAFFFCRDSLSLAYLRAQGVKTPVLEFGPDAQLGMRLRDDARALAFLDSHRLRNARFLCVVPRLRYTPYYRINQTARVPDDDRRDAINSRTVASDHARVRGLVEWYVRRTGRHVIACPEMSYEVELAKEAIVDPLPPAVREKVVWMDRFWLPDEAAALYARADAVVSMECHSPLIALRNGTPAIYLRQPTDTCKGQMYRDLGAGDWLIEIEQADAPALESRLDSILRDPAKARSKVKDVIATAEKRQGRMVDAVRAAALGSR